MKAIVTLVLLVGSLAKACPMLSGNFRSEKDGWVRSVTVLQNDVGGITDYVFKTGGDHAWTADGVTYTTDTHDDDGSVLHQVFTTTCDGNNVSHSYVATITLEDGTVEYEVNGVDTFGITELDELVQTNKSSDTDGDTEDISFFYKRL